MFDDDTTYFLQEVSQLQLKPAVVQLGVESRRKEQELLVEQKWGIRRLLGIHHKSLIVLARQNKL